MEAARERRLKELPQEWLTEENLCAVDEKGRSALWLAAVYGGIDQIPDDRLTEALVTRRILETAALAGHLRQFPARFLTEESLARSIDGDSTPLHWAAMTGQLEQIPSSVLTPENFSRKGKVASVLTWIAANANFDQVPLDILVACRDELVFSDRTLFQELSPRLREQVEQAMIPKRASANP